MWLMDMVFPVVIWEGEEPQGHLAIGDWEGISLADYLSGNLSEEELARTRDPRTAKIYVSIEVVKQGREAVLAILAHELAHLLFRLYRIELEGDEEEALADRAALFALGVGPLPEVLAHCVRRQNRPPEAFLEWVERHLQWFEEAYGPLPPMDKQALKKLIQQYRDSVWHNEDLARRLAESRVEGGGRNAAGDGISRRGG
ncbi:MAG: hypothetical protein QW650_09120 [Thermofilum sp.]